MAEAFAAVGLAASIVTFVDVSAKVLHRLREFYSTDDDMPGVFQDITTQLPLVVDTMTRIEEGCKDGSLTGDSQQKLLHVVKGCLRQINTLDGLIERMLPSSTDSALRRARKAIASVLKEKDIAGVRGALETYKSTLTLHFVEKCRDLNTTSRESAYFEVPPLRVSRFVGRVKLLEEIGVVFASGTRDRSCSKIVVLLALGGQGKTQLALEYCRVARASGRFQAIFWVDASSSNTASHGFEAIAAKISNKKWVFNNTEETVDFVKDTLERWESPWLIVFDNYDQPGEFGNITAYFPQGETGSILLTSRHAGSERLGVAIKIPGMAEDEGLELLLRQSRLEKSDDNAMEGRKIIEKLGYLPLAIDQAGAYISARNLPLHLFAEHYDKRKEVVLKHTPLLWEYQRTLGGGKDEATLSAFTTWELSFQQIAKDENERTMVGHFLTLSAFFDASNVGEDLFRSYLVSTNDPPKWMQVFTSGGTWNQHKYQDTIVELLSLSLLQSIDIGASESRFSLHPLVTDWLKLRLGFEARQEYTIEAMIFLGNHIDVQDIDLLPSRTKMDMISHADICLRNDKEYFLESDESNLISLRETVFNFGLLYHDRCRYQVAEAMYQRALAGYEKTLGPEHTSILNIVDTTGCLYADQGKLAEAEAMFQRALVGREKVLGPEHMLTLATIKNLGGIYSKQGKLMEGEAKHQQVLTGCEKTLGPEHELTLDTVYGLGNIYLCQGKLAKAEAMYRRVLTVGEKALDPNHRLILYAAHSLANICSEKGMLAEAETLYQRSLLGKENVLGLEDLSTLATVRNLGDIYADQSRLAGAEAMYQRALAGYEKILGPEHTSTLDTVTDLGRLYAKQGKLAEAEALFQRALVGKEKVLGPAHISTLDAIRNLGTTYAYQDRLAEAEATYKRVLVEEEKALGPEHASTLTTVCNLGRLYAEQGKLVDAEAMFQRALVGGEKVLGSAHISTLDATRNLGTVYADQGRLAEAEAMYERALVGEKALGPEHTSTLATVCNLGCLYAKQGKLAEAEAMFQRALVGEEKAMGPEHASTLATVCNLGRLYAEQGKLAEAEAMFQRALVGKEKALGPEHTSTLSIASSLGRLYAERGKLAEAEDLHRRYQVLG